MCERFYEQLGTKISDICGPKLEVRKIMNVDKLIWILFNVDFDENENNGNQKNQNQKNQNSLLKKTAPYNREQIYAVKIDIKINENKQMITKQERIYIIYTNTQNGRSFVNSLHNGGVYDIDGLVSISLPDCLKSLFDSSYGNDRYKLDHYKPDRPCILNDTLKSALTKEQMALCELNEVFGPVVKVDKDWVVVQ